MGIGHLRRVRTPFELLCWRHIFLNSRFLRFGHRRIEGSLLFLSTGVSIDRSNAHLAPTSCLSCFDCAEDIGIFLAYLVRAASSVWLTFIWSTQRTKQNNIKVGLALLSETEDHISQGHRRSITNSAKISSDDPAISTLSTRKMLSSRSPLFHSTSKDKPQVLHITFESDPKGSLGCQLVNNDKVR